MVSAFQTGRGPVLVIVSLVLLVIAYIAVGLRFWCRHELRRKLFAHDILILGGLACSTGLVIMWILDVQHGGLGQHGAVLFADPDVTKKLRFFGKIQVAMQPIWATAMTFTRLSILNLYMHIFSLHARFRKICWVMVALVFLWFPSDLIAAFLVCRPIAFNWDQTIPGGHCADPAAPYIAIHTSNLVIDVIIAFLPAPVLWNLQMRTNKKIAIIAMFSVGAIICAISVSRLALFKQVDLDSPEFMYESATLYLFTGMEPLLAISLACMPLLRPAGEILASSSAMLWIRSFTTSISLSRGGSKLSTDKAKPPSSSSERPLPLFGAPFQKSAGGEDTIMVEVELNQSYEMQPMRPHDSHF